MEKTMSNMERTSRAVIEFMGACDTKVTVDLNHVEYIKEDKLVIGGIPGTTIYFTSGNHMFIQEKYDSVRDMLNAFKMDTDTGIEE